MPPVGAVTRWLLTPEDVEVANRFDKSKRFYSNPALRDEEWNEATRAPWWQMAMVLACIGAGFFAGFYAETPYNLFGWLLAAGAILVHFVLARARENRARRELRRKHEQSGWRPQSSPEAAR
jgi:hypothetical protein